VGVRLFQETTVKKKPMATRNKKTVGNPSLWEGHPLKQATIRLMTAASLLFGAMIMLTALYIMAVGIMNVDVFFEPVHKEARR
jgi:hypothetical protein